MSTNRTIMLQDALLALNGEPLMARARGAQEGTLVVKAGSYHAQYRAPVQDENGNIVYKIVSRKVGDVDGKDRITKTEAKSRLRKLVDDANTLVMAPQGVATLRQFVDWRFRTDKISRKRKTTKLLYEWLLKKHIYPSLGDWKLATVTPLAIQQLLEAKMRSGLSTQTVRHVYNLLSGIFRHARGLRFLTVESPCAGVQPPAVTHKARVALTWQQIQMLAAAMPKPHQGVMVLLMGGLGLRAGEAMGLTWQRVNLTAEGVLVGSEWIPPYSILVAEQFVLGELGQLKTGKSRRILPLTSTLWVALSQWKERTKWNGPEQPVFPNRDGQFYDRHNFSNRIFGPTARAAGMPWVTLHVLRHSAATLGHAAGMSMIEQMKVMGHGSASTTMGYTHPEVDAVRAKLERVQ